MDDQVTILYIEDDKDIREVMIDIIELEFSNVLVAADGEEGLKIFKENQPDIIISDIQMPKMDGLAMYEEMKKLSDNIKIIFTTAFNEQHHIEKALEYGVSKYINKPIDVNVLFENINLLIEEINLEKKQ